MTNTPDRNRRRVWSTDVGPICPRCLRATSECRCREEVAAASVDPKDAPVRVGRETKGRKGKGVTVVTGLPLRGKALDDLASRLKKRCGSGGTVREDAIEIQGDHRDAIVTELEALGYRPKKAGG
jgi:translation initiation factor 1